jgi:uncharacterized membrane protein YuzA (DUF378 family)
LNKKTSFGNTIVAKEVFNMIDKIALILSIIGGLNWGLVGIFQFDLVAFIGGGQTGIISRIIYILVGLAAIWCISLLFRDNEIVEDTSINSHA